MIEFELKTVGGNKYLFKNGIPIVRLNETSAVIVELYLKGLSKTEIAENLVEQYSVNFQEASSDVENLLGTLYDSLC